MGLLVDFSVRVWDEEETDKAGGNCDNRNKPENPWPGGKLHKDSTDDQAEDFEDSALSVARRAEMHGATYRFQRNRNHQTCQWHLYQGSQHKGEVDRL